jgi:hypothetical protein
MHRVITVLSFIVLCIFVSRPGLNLAGQTTGPPLVQFNGVIENPAGLTGPQSVTFALYKDQSGGAPLWQETQNVTIESNGYFTVLLGAGTPGGIPVQLFAAEIRGGPVYR